MASIQGPFVSMALTRLRRGVSVCCWLVASALVLQILIWCAATFLDVRFQVVKANAPTQLIVKHSEADRSNQTLGSASVNGAYQTADGAPPVEQGAVDPNRVPTKFNLLMEKASALMMSTGTLAMVLMVPFLALGVVLGAGSATPGVDKTVSAFMWSLFASLLVLPLGELLNLPWEEGALTSYAYMTQQVDLQLSNDQERWGALQFYSRFLVLPLACVVSTTIVGLRFSLGVSMGILPKESMRLDPALEKEAANITPSSLHGGRAGAALKAIGGMNNGADRKVTAPLAHTTAGEAPRRLI
jgi:hypothetical protein